MACGIDIHLNDIGTVFEITIKDCGTVVDLTTTSAREVIFVKPDGTRVTYPAVLKTGGSDGIITYTTVDGDLDQTGTWKLQAKVTMPLGTWSSDVTKFKVLSNL